MALGGFGLNPFADIAHLGNNIGSVFGNPNEASAQLPVTGQVLSAAFGTPSSPSGPGVPGSGASQTGVTSNPAPQGTQPSGYYGTTGAYSGGTTGVGSPDYSIFKGLYDNEIGNLQNQYNALPAYQDEATGSVNLQYNPQLNTLNTQNASGTANLDLAQNQLDTQHSQGLRNLGNQLRTALNGYQNQIGVMGAGNSSAAPLIGYALSQQGNRSMADMSTNFNQQQSGLDLQRKNLQANYQNQLDSLNAWKQSNLNDIAARYSQTQQQLQNQIMGAQGDEARYLAMYGQTALANQVISQMQGLEAQYKDQVGQLNSHFQQVAAPQADISKYAGPYQINQISPDQLQQLSFANNQVDDSAPTAIASLTKKPDQSPNVGF